MSEELETNETTQESEVILEGFPLRVEDSLWEDERVLDVIPQFTNGVVEQFSVLIDTSYGQLSFAFPLTEVAHLEAGTDEDLVAALGQKISDIITANEPVFIPGYDSVRVQTAEGLASDYAVVETNDLFQTYNQYSQQSNSLEHHLLWLELYRRGQIG